jgi:hypothetical protein
MNPSHYLGNLYRPTSKPLAKLRKTVSGLSFPVNPRDDLVVAWAVIESANLWAAFLRAYYISGAIQTKTRSGVSVRFLAVSFPNVDAAIRFAIKQSKGKPFTKPTISRRDEPTWHDLRIYLSLQKTVSPTNLTQLYTAFSTGMTFPKYLQTIRNSYAHRCDETFRKAGVVAVKLGLATKPGFRPTRLVCSRLPKRPQNLMTDWIDEMQNAVDLLCA